jgi:RimJ/RimL family protein N-acetyltransferase
MTVMSEIVLTTERLRLVLESPEEVLGRIEALSPAERAEVSPVWLELARAATTADPWLHGFRVTDRITGVVVGGCGFKGPPDAEGMVEIAYGIDPQHQRRGYATEAAGALIAFAFETGQVRIIRAHTKPDNAASARVLVRCGFERLGEVIDPEDGLVVRWEQSEKRVTP